MLSGATICTRTFAVPGALEAQELRRPPRHVDDPAARVRAAVVDAQLDRPAVLEIGHLHDARHRQRAMRRRQPR